MDFISGYCRFAPSIIIYERYKIWKMPSSLSLFLKESKGWAAAAAAAATDGCSHLKMKNLLFTAAFWKNKLKNAKNDFLSRTSCISHSSSHLWQTFYLCQKWARPSLYFFNFVLLTIRWQIQIFSIKWRVRNYTERVVPRMQKNLGKLIHLTHTTTNAKYLWHNLR